jgi:hypothetical protein
MKVLFIILILVFVSLDGFSEGAGDKKKAPVYELKARPDSTDANDWYIYPNPATNYFNLQSNHGTLLPYLRVYNSSGGLVYRKFIGNDCTWARIDVAFLPGTYYVSLSDFEN